MRPSSARIRTVAGVPSGKTSPLAHKVRKLGDVLTPMRDGVSLAMDLLRPEGSRRLPVILVRTPYNKVASLSSPRASPFLEQLAGRGYIVAVQDCRGRFNSDGDFDPYRQEPRDGFDTIEWIAQQDWCDGNIGMVGGSYVGQTQWLAASQVPKALRAIVPTASPPGHPFLNEPFYGGVMLMAVPEWMFAMGRRCERVAGLQGLYTQEHAYLGELPIARIAASVGVSCAWWDEWLAHPTFDEYWQSHGYEQFWSRMTVPALNITGWWDMNFLGAPRNFVAMRQHGATTPAREGQRLVIGPWPHWVNQTSSLNGVDFGHQAVTDLDAYTIAFLDYWVRGHTSNGLNAEAPVHVFVVGANEWWESDEWPLPGTRFTSFYLHSAGSANTHRGNGTLSSLAPDAEPFDQYTSDPHDPIRVLWNLHEGPVDDRPITARADVLCYTTDELREPIDVVGPVTAVLYASSSGADCDWHVRLVDVHPDGSARFLCHGALRARFRNGYEKAALLQPDRVERFEIDMTATGIRFLPGHRIRVEISSSWFSRFERNPQTGAPNWMTDDRPPAVGIQRVFHSREYPSYVSLPVIA